MNAINRSFLLWTILAVLATELGLAVTILLFRLEFDLKIGVTAFTATPLLVLAILQLARTLREQRAAFVRDYVSQFFTKSELYQAFHDLIYTYSTAKYQQVDSLARQAGLLQDDGEPVSVSCARGEFTFCESVQDGRAAGERLYHPALFQGSPEERKLDSLLGYFNVLAFYYVRGFIRLEDIAGSIGYFLAVMNSRHCVKEYIRLAENVWRRREYRETMGATRPFVYLKRLLADVDSYNKHYASRIEKEAERQIT